MVNNSGNPNTQVNISAMAVTLANSGGTLVQAINPSLTCNTAGIGANGLSTDVPGGALAAFTWYHFHVIYNGTTVASLCSISATAPVLPTGYSYSCYVGSKVTDASSHLLWARQTGNKVLYYPNQVPAVSANSAWTAVNLAAFVPPNAIEVIISVIGGGSGLYADFSVDGTATYCYLSDPYSMNPQLTLPLFTPQEVWYLGNVANPMAVMGYMLNI